MYAESLDKIRQGPKAKPRERGEMLGVELSDAFDRWFAIATDKDPARRFATARNQHEALKLALRSEGVAKHIAIEDILIIKLTTHCKP